MNTQLFKKPEAEKAQDESTKEELKVETESAEVAAPEDDSVIFSSHPIMRFSLGTRWQFQNGVLKLSAAEAAEFEESLAKQPPVIRAKVQKIDVGRANALAAKHVRGRTVQGIDNSENGPASPEVQHN